LLTRTAAPTVLHLTLWWFCERGWQNLLIVPGRLNMYYWIIGALVVLIIVLWIIRQRQQG
jgi:hypothetical protein